MAACGASHPERPEISCLATSGHDHHYGYDGPVWHDKTVEWPNESFVSTQRTSRGRGEVALAEIAGSISSRRGVDENVIEVGATHPETSHLMAARKVGKTGTQRRRIYDLSLSRGDQGVTDDEAEQVLGLLHQSASSARHSLMKDGWLVDTGVRRLTRSGEEAIAWVAAQGG